jgi:hypothetical protein
MTSPFSVPHASAAGSADLSPETDVLECVFVLVVVSEAVAERLSLS